MFRKIARRDARPSWDAPGPPRQEDVCDLTQGHRLVDRVVHADAVRGIAHEVHLVDQPGVLYGFYYLNTLPRRRVREVNASVGQNKDAATGWLPISKE